MKAALVTGRARVELTDFPEPLVAPGKAVVDIALCGICGTDVHAYQSGAPYTPAICGHEWVGRVAGVGDGVTGLREGDRVVAGMAAACGHCDQCGRGLREWCSSAFLGMVGQGPMAAPHGGFAPRIAVEARRLSLVPDKLTDVEAALVEPATVAVHAVRRTPIRLGDTVVVLGGGPIGLLTAQCARAAGAGRIFVVEPNAQRAALASELGADLVFDPRGDDIASRINAATEGQGADVVFECAGISPTLQQAVDLVRRGGAVTLVGVSNDDATISPRAWLLKEVTFNAVLGYLHEEFAIAMALIADGRLRVAPLHSITVGLEEIEAVFAELATGKGHTKVLVSPR